MMEMAKNVRDVLVGMKEVMSPEEETLLMNLQELHEQYLVMMDKFSIQVSNLALSMRPETRIVAHQLRLRVYQDWRANLMERIFGTVPLLSTSPPISTRVSPPSTPIVILEPQEEMEKTHTCACDVCVCHLIRRLQSYEKVIADYLQTSIQSKKRIASTDAVTIPKRFCETMDGLNKSVSVVPLDMSDDSTDEQEAFVFPDFLNISPPS